MTASKSSRREFLKATGAGLAGAALAGGVIGLQSHVHDPHADEDAKERFQIAGRARAGDRNQQPEDDGVHQALGVLAVIDGAHSGDEAQQAGEARRHIVGGDGSREWRGGRGGGFLRDVVHHGRSRGAFGGGRRMLVAENGALRGALAFVAERLAAGAAISHGRRIGMIETVHMVSPYINGTGLLACPPVP